MGRSALPSLASVLRTRNRVNYSFRTFEVLNGGR